MTRIRQLALLVGVVASLAGLSIIAGIPLGLELTDIFLGLTAALAGIQALRYIQRRRNATILTSSTNDPEMRVAVPYPGADVDDDIVTAMSYRMRWAARERIIDRLERSATRALVLRGGYTPESAQTMLDEGNWTEDMVAARFLGANVSVPILTRLRLLVSGQSALTVRVARAVTAIERIGDDDWSPNGRIPNRSQQTNGETNEDGGWKGNGEWEEGGRWKDDGRWKGDGR